MATAVSYPASDLSRRRYSGVAMAFHWAIATLVIVNWQIAERAEGLEGALRGEMIGYHKAVGITILALTLARLGWRLAHPVPPLPAHHAAWERVLARMVHAVFYVLLIGLPLGGWLAGSFSGRPIDYFGLFTVPVLPVSENRELAGAIMDFHTSGAMILIYLVGLHVLGVLKHLIIDRDRQISRMLPFGTPKA